MKYGFNSAGGGTWYSNSLGMLEPGSRIWVNVPSRGYVGVGKVTAPVCKVDEFTVKNDDGQQIPISEAKVKAVSILHDQNDAERAVRSALAANRETADGGKAVMQSADHGTPLADSNPKNPLRKEIMKLAKSVHEVNVAATADTKA